MDGAEMTGVRYVHTNLIARDWRRLATFYEAVFGCRRLTPERDISDDWLARGTGLPNARLRGAHLRLPGYDDDGPTVEIFEYERQTAAPSPAKIDQPGYGHIAFEVDDIERMRRRVIDEGGSEVGEVVSATIEGAGTITFVYVADPEGNIVELQRWER